MKKSRNRNEILKEKPTEGHAIHEEKITLEKERGGQPIQLYPLIPSGEILFV